MEGNQNQIIPESKKTSDYEQQVIQEYKTMESSGDRTALMQVELRRRGSSGLENKSEIEIRMMYAKMRVDQRNKSTNKFVDSEIVKHFKPEPIDRRSDHYEARRISDAEALFKASGVPERHVRKLPDIKYDGGWETTYKEISGRIDDGIVVALLGNRGTGKTQIATKIIRDTCNNGISAKYSKASDIFRSIRSCYSQVARGDRQETESEVFRRWASYGLLVIDESHERGETTAENQALINIVDRRYDSMRSTIFIANQTREEFARSVGPSIISRIHECGEAFVCDWGSFRTPGQWRME